MPFPSLTPNRLTMEGMIDQSSKVLDKAAQMDRNGALSLLFQRAKGVMMISVVDSAFLLAGSAGTGICMAKDEDGKWSPPCCCGLAGTGWGFGIGAQMKDMIVFAFDEKTVNSFTSRTGLKVSAGTNLTLGTSSVDAGANLTVSSSGVGGGGNVAKYSTKGTVTISFSMGALAVANVAGFVVGPRNHVNSGFYGKDVSASDILFGKEELSTPGKVTALDELYKKLHLLTKGSVEEVNPAAFDEAAELVPEETIKMIEQLSNEVSNKLDEEPTETGEVNIPVLAN